MERTAEVLRTIEVSGGEKLKPGTTIDESVLANWREQNIGAMVKDGRLRIIEGIEAQSDDDLKSQVIAQAERINELESKLKENNLMFDPEIHMSDENGPLLTKKGLYRRQRGSKK